MTENVENLILEHLRSLRNQVETLQGQMHHEFRDVKLRLSSLESSVVGLRRNETDTAGDLVRQQARLDELSERIRRIEKRLELID
jgi:uncharacterized protein involved in exopolysaccharide biosynthesis